MARSFSSYGQGFSPGYKRGSEFQPNTITGGAGYQSSVGDLVNLGGTYGTLRENAVDFGKLASTAVANRAAERATAMKTEAEMHATSLTTKADVLSNKLIADARKDAAQAQASGSMMGSALGAIGSIGGALIGLSDERTKENIERIEDALTTLRNLNPVTFYYKEEYSTQYDRMHHGFIAQEYNKIMPDATYYDSSIDKLCIDTGDLIGLLVRAIQQLETKVTRLEAEIALEAIK